MKKLLIVIDMQNDFIDGSLGTKEAQAMLPRLAAKLQQAEDTDLIFTQDTHQADYLSTQEGKNLPVKHCIKPSHGWEIAVVLQPFAAKAKAVIEKPAFGSLELIKAAEGYEEAEFTGLCTDICVISNAMILKAAYPEMKIAVDASCCAGVTPEKHDAALAVMESCQVIVRR